MRLFLALTIGSALSVAVISAEPTLAWPQFRGPSGAGIFDGKLPTTWSTRENVAWSVEVKGRGWSSPVAWNDTVFVTSAISAGAFKAPSTGIFGNDYVAELAKQGLSEDEVVKRVVARDIELTAESGEIRYMVYAFDANSGKLKWEREAHNGSPFGGRHRKNTFCVGDAGHRRRASLRVLRERRTIRVFARRQVAVDDEVRSAADVPRLRHGGFADRQRRACLRRPRQRRAILCRCG